MNRPRKDPRAERRARAVPGQRPRYDLARRAETPGGRPRLDPRVEIARARVPGGARLRLDRTQHAGSSPAVAVGAMSAAPPAGTTLLAAPTLRVVAEPAFFVFAVADAPDGRLTGHDRQVLGGARLLADAGGGAVVLLAPPLVDDAGAAGADRLLALPSLGYAPETLAAALLAEIAVRAPRHILFPESPDGGDLARRVAVSLGEPLFADVEQLSARTAIRPTGGRRREQAGAPPRLMTLGEGRVAPHLGDPHEARTIDPCEPTETTPGILRAEAVPADPATVSLADARFVVSAGNGITDFASFKRLAAALGATPGASRVVCDAGLMPRAAQVGASGTVLDADCYFALGIAGAPQHLQGIAGCEHVVAVNTDLHAAMVERAELSIIADAQAVMPALLRLLAEGGA
ncbi:electron transfer flavoprotein subunit alpha/FixB family protein [Aurantimonas sp. MSK8Z-1]|uniref:electron transfer flavoprotein subunit alpha/FixB family protein n=1 Tax=Mangrovibrevibacter kandeliae TaxID=2968473 RepID=UPI002119567E|nr:electron transfer flavoprotein subunit alpha/FixB family protein [Aurantimonas sp. MSK8Z-1]MCW4113539.1 electron transfer flavoprotein subunit alpha/FixB family protein [Aurantimonas sp. MSK8Z-1]